MTLAAAVHVRRPALTVDVELDVGDGEVVAVVGPNGAGKSTLLAALSGLIPLARGRVAIDGAGMSMPPQRRPIGVVFQDLLLFPHLSALENVAFGLRARGVPRAGARRRASEWLERVGAGGVADVRPPRLSGGQAQRVALARALVVRPRLLLLDEPLAAVDAAGRPELRRAVARELRSFGGAAVVVTHDVIDALALGDRLVVLEDGVVVQTGTPDDVRRRPRSRYAADLVGVNLFRGRSAGGVVEVEGGGSLVAPGAPPGQVFAVVHPRAVALYRQRPEGTPRNVWRAQVTAVDPEGDRARVVLGGPLALVAEVTPASVEELSLADGGPVWVTVKATEVDVYPA